MSQTKILVVEDEAIVARDIVQQLTRLGYEPVGKTSRGEQALVLAGQLRPDLVLMDIYLAGEMDGVGAAEAIRKRFKIPVVFLTAFADDATLERARVTEPFGYIVKPFRGQDLHSIIEMALYKHRADVALHESEEFIRAILDSVATHIAVLDRNGVIVAVNEPWRRFALENGTESGRPARRTEVGVNYLEVCHESTGDSSEAALSAHDGSCAVLEGRLPRGVGVATLRDAPAEWSHQHARLGLSS